MMSKIKQYIGPAVMFAAFMFLYMTTYKVSAVRDFIPPEQQEISYYIYQIFLIAGYLSFALVRGIVRGAKGRRLAAASALFVYGAGTLCALLTRSASVCFIAASAAMLSLGHIGAMVYYRMSCALSAGKKAGAVMGIAFSAAVLMQYLFQPPTGGAPLLPYVMLLSFAALGCVLLRADAELTGGTDAEGNVGRAVVCAVIVTAAFALFNSFYDGYIHQKQVATGYTEYNVFQWPRLTVIPVYLALGFLDGVRNGKYIPIVSLCIMAAALMQSVLISTGEAYTLNMCLFYMTIAASISYYNLVFWRLAPKTKHPELTAVLGRPVAAAAEVILGLAHFSGLSVTAVLALNIVCLVLVIVVMALNGDLTLSALGPERAEVSAPSKAHAPEEALDALQKRFSLTPAETKLLRELVTTEDKQAVIAERLGVKVGTVQYHTTSIYRKTNASTRAGLSSLYHDALRGE